MTLTKRERDKLSFQDRPTWFCRDGFYVRLVKPFVSDQVVLNNRVSTSTHFTRVEIAQSRMNKVGHQQWLIHWVSNADPAVTTCGTVELGTELLRAAFADRKQAPAQQTPLYPERYGADCGAMSRFIRKGDFLNIPGSGSGFWWDPNISIWLTKDIKVAVQQLIQNHPS